MKNTKAGADHREEFQLLDPKLKIIAVYKFIEYWYNCTITSPPTPLMS